ncbi:MAG: hypothetical protein AABZ47_08050 [Planctomycetota bacterium]
MKFLVLDIQVQRDGDHITGEVRFPYTVGGNLDEYLRAYREGKRCTGRDSCPIDYHAASDQNRDGHRPTGRDGAVNSSCALSPRAQVRLSLVTRCHQLTLENPKLCQGTILQRAIDELPGDEKKPAVRSLQNWLSRYRSGGAAALEDNYSDHGAVRNATDEVRKHALCLCAWWSFRIGNCDVINAEMMTAACNILQTGHTIGNLTSIVDCYYSYQTDRSRYPFKPFSKWLRYDFETWLFRAADESDYRHAIEEGRTEQTELQTLVRKALGPFVHNSKQRRRFANDRRLRQDIASLAAPCATASKPCLPSQVSLADSLQSMDPRFRSMLLDASKRHGRACADAQHRAAATLPMWWDSIPPSIRGNIDFQVEQWKKTHNIFDDKECHLRRVLMLGKSVRCKDAGFQQMQIARALA